MHLVQLLYASTPSPSLGPNDLQSILESAQRRNAETCVTGLLCFRHDCFLQALEGGREAVNQTYHRICRDNRHGRVILLAYGEIAERSFHNWSMGYVSEARIARPVLLKYHRNDQFDPYHMSGINALRLLLELRDTAVMAPTNVPDAPVSVLRPSQASIR